MATLMVAKWVKEPLAAEIEFDTFAAVDLRVALILKAEAVEVEVHGAEPAFTIDDKVGADIAHPYVVQLRGDKGE